MVVKEAPLPLEYRLLQQHSPIPRQYRFLQEFERRIINRLPPPEHELELRQRAIASAQLGLALAEKRWASKENRVVVWLGGLCHDIGKGRMWKQYLKLHPDDISPEQKQVLKRVLWDWHTRRALEIIREAAEAVQKKVNPLPEEKNMLNRVREDILQHENVDGRHSRTGRMMVIADAYAAYSRQLPYRPKLRTPAARLARIRKKYSHPHYREAIAALERLAPHIRKRFPIVEG
ncbi:MAG: HD domain-containing protein [Candidatus Micrarchaeota archaeon]